MNGALQKLLSISSRALGDPDPVLTDDLRSRMGSSADALLEMLRLKNGFYAFESALHVFPASSSGAVDLAAWNDPDGWRSAYKGMADDGVFFAEDVFGCQFVLSSDGVRRFDPETAQRDDLAPDLERWAALMLSDHEYQTGYPLAQQWQRTHGAIPFGMRLVPTIPFVLGGAFDIDNLHLLKADKGMRLRGCIATQIKDLPDGMEIQIDIVD